MLVPPVGLASGDAGARLTIDRRSATPSKRLSRAAILTIEPADLGLSGGPPMLIGITAAVAGILAGLAFMANRRDARNRRFGHAEANRDTVPLKTGRRG